MLYLTSNQNAIQGHSSQSTLSSASFRSAALASLQCELPNTIIAIQPSIHASDFENDAAPQIRKYVAHAGSKIVVPYGYGEVDSEEVVSTIAKQCDATIERIDASSMSHPIFEAIDERRLIVVSFPTLPLSNELRKIAMSDNDAFLHSLLKSLPSQDFNLLYLSTPPPASPASFRRAHISLNDDSASAMKSNRNATGGLFSRYQYFTPGIFMGYMALLILVPVLVVSLKAINSVQVSYKAFEPPMKIGQKQ